jgi:hypothetical protein
VLFLCLAASAAHISSSTSAARRSECVNDAPELNTDEAFILAQDFVTEIANAFMPEAKPWCERGPGMDMPPASGKVKKDVAGGRPEDFRRHEGVEPVSGSCEGVLSGSCHRHGRHVDRAAAPGVRS